MMTSVLSTQVGAENPTTIPQNSSSVILSRLPDQVNFSAYAEDPDIYIRNPWTRPGGLSQRLPVGTSVAIGFGEQTLVCSLRKGLQAVSTIYSRMVPSDIAVQEDITIDPWPQWRLIGNASNFFGFDKALLGMPWRWTFKLQGNSVVIVPDAKLLTTALGLQITRPFASEALLEIHPYLGSWDAGSTFLDRHPPIYPLQYADAWGWLLPTAPWNFELEGYRFCSVWEYAVNPILRNRNLQQESILERLMRATQHRLVMDDAWRERARQHGNVIRYLADKTNIDEKEHSYFPALTHIIC